MRQNNHSTKRGSIAKIGDLLPQLIVQYGLHRRRNLEQIEGAWRQAIGEQFAAVTQIEKFYRGTLTIKVPHNAYVQELSFRQSELVEVLATLLTEERVKKIRFVV